MYRTYRVPKLIFFLGGERARLFERGPLLQTLSLRKGAYSKRDAFLKLGTNLSIYGKSTVEFLIIWNFSQLLLASYRNTLLGPCNSHIRELKYRRRQRQGRRQGKRGFKFYYATLGNKPTLVLYFIGN